MNSCAIICDLSFCNYHLPPCHWETDGSRNQLVMYLVEFSYNNSLAHPRPPPQHASCTSYANCLIMRESAAGAGGSVIKCNLRQWTDAGCWISWAGPKLSSSLSLEGVRFRSQICRNFQNVGGFIMHFTNERIIITTRNDLLVHER